MHGPPTPHSTNGLTQLQAFYFAEPVSENDLKERDIIHAPKYPYLKNNGLQHNGRYELSCLLKEKIWADSGSD
jgi:hypothetical protein